MAKSAQQHKQPMAKSAQQHEQPISKLRFKWEQPMESKRERQFQRKSIRLSMNESND